MLVRLVCVVALGVVVVATGVARAGCAEDVSRLMSKDTERLLSQYNRVTRRIEREGSTANLRAEECRIARQLEPQLASQVAAMKESKCRRDPSVANMLADIVQGHEDDLAVLRKVTTQPDCR
jgi:phosphopantothenoylcysteine synthetase/decarboxylase